MFTLTYDQKGFAAFFMTILVLAIMLGLAFSITILVLGGQRISKNIVKSSQAYYIAEAGLEDAIYRIKNNISIISPYTIEVGAATATVSVATAGNTKTIVVQGDRNDRIRNIQAVLSLNIDEIDFFFGVQVGEGGLEMDNNSQVIGNVYSNGSIIGASNTVINGDVIIGGGVEESASTRSTVCNQDQIAGQANPEIDFAQSFVAPSSDSLAKVSIYLKKVGSPGDRSIRIVVDDFGSPDDSELTSGMLFSSLVTGSYGWVDVIFSSPASLISGNTYWIVLDAKRNGNDYWIWCKDSNNGYGNGVGKYSKDWDDDPWTLITGDLTFKTYFGAGITLIDSVVVIGDAQANTIINSEICGDAYYQSIDANSLNFLNSPTNPTCPDPLTDGTAYPGSPDPPISNMPISQANIDDWKSDATAGGQIIGDYVVTSDVSLGPVEITGDLLMIDNNKTLTITGTIYVQGNIDLDNGSAIQCDSSYGINSCVIVSDGWIHATNNGTFSGSGDPVSFLLLLTTSSCRGVPASDCTHHNAAADLHNNATGVIFYAADGMINLHNGVNVTEATAYKLRIDNTATVTYSMGLIDASFSSGPSAGWVVSDWKEVP